MHALLHASGMNAWTNAFATKEVKLVQSTARWFTDIIKLEVTQHEAIIRAKHLFRRESLAQESKC
jgi:hypothetical protein